MLIIKFWWFWLVFNSVYTHGIDYHTQILKIIRKPRKLLKKNVLSCICRQCMKLWETIGQYMCFLCFYIVDLMFIMSFLWFLIVLWSIVAFRNDYNIHISQTIVKFLKFHWKNIYPVESARDAWNTARYRLVSVLIMLFYC